MSLNLDFSVDEGLDFGTAEAEPLVRSAVEAVLRLIEVDEASISVTLLGDDAIAEINSQYLGHEGPTDVISFPLWENGEPVVGDIYVGLEQARRQAEDMAVPLPQELRRLVIHGTLHVLGYDHPEGEEREDSEMWLLQEQILREVEG